MELLSIKRCLFPTILKNEKHINHIDKGSEVVFLSLLGKLPATCDETNSMKTLITFVCKIL